AGRTEPLRKAKDRVIDGADEAALQPVEVKIRRRSGSASKDAAGAGKASSPSAKPVAEPPRPAGPPELAAFDRKSARRIRSGRIE
ncbi:hypothetical protein ABTM87_19725, partial [Acinetobacter baumannii]